MIINRYRATVRRGRRLEALRIVQERATAKRICLSMIGDNDIITWDVEFENVAAMGTFFDELQKPETQAGMSAWWDVTVSVENEILRVFD